MSFRFVLINMMLITCLSSCSTISEKERIGRQFLTGVTKIDRLDFLDKEFVVIMPRIGCLGCISSVEQFLVDYALSDNDKLGFLLIDILSVKVASIRFGEEVIHAKNVFLDRESVFDFSESISIYPAILQLDDRRVVSVDYVSPDNPLALDKLIMAID